MTAKARKPRKPRAKALQAAPDPIRREPKMVEWAMDDIEDNARRLKALLVVIERVASTLETSAYLCEYCDADGFISLTSIARQLGEELVRSAESAPRP